MIRLLALLGGLLVVAVAAGLGAQPAGGFGDLSRTQAIHYIACALAAGALYAAGVWLVRHRPAPRAVPLILAAGLVARLLVLMAPPVLSTDIYRYVWDGRVQAAGINPYRYLPVDPALAPLRDPPGPRSATAIFPNINRADTAPTIYPPAAQALFALLGATIPGIWTMKAAMLAFDLATTALLLLLLRLAARPVAHVLVWAWNPLVIWEFAGAGHIDAMAIALTTLAIVLATQRRTQAAAAALALAVLTKLLPAALFPALWRRWDWKTPLVAALVILGGYALYASAGWRVFGYLGGYTQEEHLQDGGGFLLLRLLALARPLPPWAGTAYAAVALLGLGVAALWVVRRPLPAAPAARAVVIARGVLLLSAALIAAMSPHYPWYLTLLVMPAVLVPSAAALWPTLAGPLLYLDFARGAVLWPALVFLPSLACLAFDLRPNRPAPAPALLAEGGS